MNYKYEQTIWEMVNGVVRYHDSSCIQSQQISVSSSIIVCSKWNNLCTVYLTLCCEIRAYSCDWHSIYSCSASKSVCNNKLQSLIWRYLHCTELDESSIGWHSTTILDDFHGTMYCLMLHLYLTLLYLSTAIQFTAHHSTVCAYMYHIIMRHSTHCVIIIFPYSTVV